MYFQNTNPPAGRGSVTAILKLPLPKTSSLAVTALLGATLLTTTPEAAFGQTRPDPGPESPVSESEGRDWSKLSAIRVTKEQTDGVAAALRQAARFCDLIPERVYLIDCYASELRRIAQDLPPAGDYAKARAALNAAGKEMEALVKANLDPTKPPLRVRSGGARPKSSARRLRAVTPAAAPRVAREAVEIIDRTQTVLLRATGNSDRRRAHYQQIAQSMETGTVMLRSL